MISVFPSLLPDELFYSAAARFQNLMQFRSVTAVRETLFGSIGLTAVVDLPGHLQRFLERLPVGHPYTAAGLIRNHTLFPFYEPFVPPERARVAFEALRDGNSRGIHRCLNVTGAAVVAPETLRFCGGCVEEQYNRFGTAFWRRLHQVPGVVVCPDHQIPLYATTVQRRARIDRYGYHALSRAVRESGTMLTIPDRDINHHADIAADAEWLLNTEDRASDSPALRQFYRRIALETGWIDSLNRVMTRALERALLDYYGAEFFQVTGIRFNRVGSGDTWVARLFQLPILYQVPMRHLVILRFLGRRVSDVLSRGKPACNASSGSVAGPEATKSRATTVVRIPEKAAIGPCRNPICVQFDLTGLRGLKPIGDGPRQVQVRCPTCQFAYWYDTNCPSIWGVVETGDAWDKELRRLIQETSEPQLVVAKILGVTCNLLVRLAWEKGITRPGWSARKQYPTRRSEKRVPDSAKRDEHRPSIEQLISSNPRAGRTELRLLNPTAYAWLERHDSNWLEAQLPPRRMPGGTRDTLWTRKDDLLFPQIAQAAARILSMEGRPRRITVKALSVQLGMGGGLGAMLPRLPKSRQEVEKYLESDEAYALRRIRWAAAQFAAEMVLPSTPTVLAQRAGISSRAEAERLCDFQSEYDRARAAVREAQGSTCLARTRH